jgi:transcriptional regulator with XRE-family HTH domain
MLHHSKGLIAVPETPSLRRRRLVAALKRLREEQGKTLAEAGEAAGFSEAKISRIESFKSPISGDDTFTLATALGADETTAGALVNLARSAKQTGWWASYEGDGLGRFSDFLELESDAVGIRQYTFDLIPGRLQTERYARAVIRHFLPQAEEEEIDQRVRLRLDRQQRISAPAWYILDQAALNRAVGGPDVMAEQLDYLAEVALKPRRTLQILPTAISGHPAMGVTFSLFELRDGAVYVAMDTLTGGLYLEDPADVDVHVDTWSRLQAIGANFDDSVTLVRRARDDHRSAS